MVVYDVTDPREARLLDTIVGDRGVSPESLKAFRVGRSACVATANEVSDTPSLFRRTGLAGDDDEDERKDDDEEP